MLFYSFEFMYLFLPLVLCGYFALARYSGGGSARVLLVLSSLAFYGWWDYKYIALIVPSITFNYVLGERLLKYGHRGLLAFGVACNLALIGYYKYANFFVDTVNSLAGSEYVIRQIALPLAISFFTFQQIAWLVDCNAKRINRSHESPLSYCLFVLFFPQLIAGPIVHHSEMMPQFSKSETLRFDWSNFAVGLSFFIIGLGKKVIIADNVAPYSNAVFDVAEAGTAVSTGDAWVGVLAYTSQIYFDFSGYADMAIGLAKMFNIDLPINFNSPYKAKSISDFWRRWHMTLSRFLRDYIYIPCGGNRKGEWKRQRNLMITMLLGGLWHGASWNFVIWGALHGLYLVINHTWTRLVKVHLPWFISWGLTFLVVVIAWVFFRATSFDAAIRIIEAMLTLTRSLNLTLVGDEAVWLVMASLAVAFLLPNSQQLLNRQEFLPSRQGEVRQSDGWLSIISLNRNFVSLFFLQATALISIWYLLDQNSLQEFIYFQF
ncbi:MBOAT family O-acyltransferase [Parahaliea aestuarii]|uniref:Probable alginate O-acetylase n=1 Tax=Parahaliea aestuarii TaxID=1852021 RepID=A0A5C8ZP89_9GAMM|nr:MBOAT family protein [Parahaliea aestuarii]TXS89409.1 MBOAT family protein [Parahaliea aestuarii]